MNKFCILGAVLCAIATVVSAFREQLAVVPAVHGLHCGIPVPADRQVKGGEEMSKIGISLDNHITICLEVKDFQALYTELILARNSQIGSGYLPVKDVDGRTIYFNTDKIVMIEVEEGK